MKRFIILLSLFITSCTTQASSDIYSGICRIDITYTSPEGVLKESIGTGFVFENMDTIVTAAHVVANADLLSNVTLQFKGGEVHPIKIVMNREQDWAVITMKHGWNLNFHYIFHPAKNYFLGDRVSFQGFSYGSDFLHYKSGVISCYPNSEYPFITIDSTCVPGYSGSALIDSNNNVIGIISRMDTQYAGNTFAVPITDVNLSTL